MTTNFKDLNGGDLGDAARRNDRAVSTWVRENTVPTAGFRNVIVNGGFDVTQRGQTTTATAGTIVYGLDMWRQYAIGAGSSLTVTRLKHGVGTAEPYGAATYYANAAWVPGADTVNGFILLQQPIENVYTLSSQEVVLSFWSSTSSGTQTFGLEIEQGFGTGGAPSASVATMLGQQTATTTPKRHVVRFKVPSIVGKTLGSGGNDSVSLNFWLSAGSSYSAARASGIGVRAAADINIWNVQLEAGTVATPFERRPVSTEVAMCQRYYQRLSSSQVNGVLLHGYCLTTTLAVVHWQMPVKMRSSVVFSFGGAFQACDYVGFVRAVTGFNANAANASDDVVLLEVSDSGAGLVAARPLSLRANAAGSWIALSAEL